MGRVCYGPRCPGILTQIMHFETTRKQKISTLFISTFSIMCSIYRHMCSVFFEEIWHIQTTKSIRSIEMVVSHVIYVERKLT